jgi:hypothetical protein
MNTPDLDALRLAYKQAVDAWVTAIRAEEALATPDHSETAWERWDDASASNCFDLIQSVEKQEKGPGLKAREFLPAVRRLKPPAPSGIFNRQCELDSCVGPVI